MQESQVAAPETTTASHAPLVEVQNRTDILGAYRKDCEAKSLPFVVVRDYIMGGLGKTATLQLDMSPTQKCLKREVIERLFKEIGALSVPGAVIRASQAAIRSTAVLEIHALRAAQMLLDAAMLEENRIDASPNDGQMRDERVGTVELGGSVKVSKL